MKVITPITITDDNMTSSIAEPDTSVGEEVWVDPEVLNQEGVSSISTVSIFSIVPTSSYLFLISYDSGIFRYEYSSGAVTSFGSTSYAWNGSVADNGNIYVPSSGPTPKITEIDTTASTTSTFITGYSYSMFSIALADDGYFYGFNNNGSAYRFNTDSTSLELFGEGSELDNFPPLAIKGFDGNIYGVGNGDIGVINVSSLTISSIGTHAGTYNDACISSSGVMYCVGDTGAVLEVNTITQSFEVVGVLEGEFYSVEIVNDSLLYCAGVNGLISIFGLSSLSVISTFGSHDGLLRDIVIGEDGKIYSAGSLYSGDYPGDFVQH